VRKDDRYGKVDMYLYWHANAGNDPANRWLRTQLPRALDSEARTGRSR
jgi:hypothetical protein